MVSTRRAQASATPPTTPSAERHGHVRLPQSAPGSSNKMSKELRRLTIDANPSLGGVATSSSAKTRSRRSGMRQELLPVQVQPQEQQTQEQAPHHLLLDGGVLLTPSPSDSPNSPHVRPANDAVAASHTLPERLPSPPAGKQTTFIAQTSNPQHSIESPLHTAKSTGKRKITQYFTALPAQAKSNKRRKIDNLDIDSSPLHNIVSVPEPSVATPATLPTAASAPELKSEVAEVVEEVEQETSTHVDDTAADSVVGALHVPQKDKEPDKPRDTDQEHEQNYVTAEDGPDQKQEEEKTKKREEGEDEKKALKRERELKRLQIDAKPALIDKRSRRQTTLPPARLDEENTRPAKRQRLSLPVTAVAGPSTAAAVPESADIPAEVPTEAPEHISPIAEALATPPEPNPPVFPPGTDPKLLASGEVNDKWLTKWLGYVAHITGDEDTSKVLTEDDTKELVKPDRSQESDQDRHKRISNELDMVAGWNVIENQKEATQSSPEQAPAPVKPPAKKKKQRFNPKPKGQPYIPKAKKRAQELAAKKLAKKAEAKAEAAQEVVEEDVTSKKEENEAGSAPEPTPDQPASIQKPDASTDWLTDLMNATEPVTPEKDQARKTKKLSKGKGKAKAI